MLLIRLYSVVFFILYLFVNLIVFRNKGIVYVMIEKGVLWGILFLWLNVLKYIGKKDNYFDWWLWK